MYIQTNTGLGQVETTLDINKAIRSNRIYRQTLGWQKYFDAILKFLGFTSKPSEADFAQEVAEWQRGRGLKADGMVGPSVWKMMRAAIAVGSPLVPATLVPEDATRSAAAYLDKFVHNSATLTDDHRREIYRIAEQIAVSWQTAVPIMTVKVVGHTDSTGKPDYNQALGLRRALAVHKELQRALEKQKQGLSHKVLVLASSKGTREPIDVSDTQEGKAKNRRVEVFLSTKVLASRPTKSPPTEKKPSGRDPSKTTIKTTAPTCSIFFDRDSGLLAGAGSMSARSSFLGGPKVQVRVALVAPPVSPPLPPLLPLPLPQVVNVVVGGRGSFASTTLGASKTFDTLTLSSNRCVVDDPARPALDGWSVNITADSFIRIPGLSPIPIGFAMYWRITSDWKPGKPACCP